MTNKQNHSSSPPKSCIIISILLLITICLRWLLYNKKDDFIINYGIATYRHVMSGMLIPIFVCVIILIFTFLKIFKQKQKQKEQLQDEENKTKQATAALEQLKKDQAFLSVKSKIDADNLQTILKQSANTTWNILHEELTNCIIQMETMDDYQKQLNNLILNNGADALSDTKDVLDQVEQYICRNIRKILNYMELYNPKKDSDTVELRSKLKICQTDTQDKLDKTKKFLFTLVDFLNTQGEDNNNGPELLELYKNTILESIEEEQS